MEAKLLQVGLDSSCSPLEVPTPVLLWFYIIRVALRLQATSWGAGPLPAVTVAALQLVASSWRLILTFSITSRLGSQFACRPHADK